MYSISNDVSSSSTSGDMKSNAGSDVINRTTLAVY